MFRKKKKRRKRGTRRRKKKTKQQQNPRAHRELHREHAGSSGFLGVMAELAYAAEEGRWEAYSRDQKTLHRHTEHV